MNPLRYADMYICNSAVRICGRLGVVSTCGSSEVIGLQVGDSSVESQTAVPFNKSNNSGYLETVKYVEC